MIIKRGLFVFIIIFLVITIACTNQELSSRPDTSSETLNGDISPEPLDTKIQKKSDKCPDGIWDEAEQKDPNLCPEDKPNKTLKESVQQDSVEKEPLIEKNTKIDYIDYSQRDLDIAFKVDKTSKADWVGEDKIGAPWLSALYFATSTDGIHFEGKELFIHHAGVPNLLLTSDNTLIAVFQYFSYNYIDMYDVIAYTYSKDLGKTWQPVRRLEVPGTCNIPRYKCNDPSLVETEDRKLRLYFSHNEPDDSGMFSAVTKNIDDPFINEGNQLEPGDFADPAVEFFNGKWHHYSIKEAISKNKYINVHSISEGGLNFERQGDFEAEMGFLGHTVVDGDTLYFHNGGDVSSSKDGYTWEYLGKTGIEGADPGIVKMPDGSFLMLYLTGYEEE